jgi:deoxyribodipyrimidine photo-lyase
MRSMVWFRGKDLRVADHQPLLEAASQGEVIPLFVLDDFFFSSERAKELPHRMQFLLDSLRSLEDNLKHLGSRLLIASGRSVDLIPKLAELWKVDQVLAHRWTEPFARERDLRIEASLNALKIRFRLFEGETLGTPGSVRNQSGGMFGVFTPFSKAFLRDVRVAPPLSAPKSLPPIPSHLDFVGASIPSMDSLGLKTNPRVQTGGEREARSRMKHFLAESILGYGDRRNRMDVEGTSRLSADLKFGTLSARTLWHAASGCYGLNHDGSVRAFQNELLWREFSHHLLWDRPTLLKKPFREAFEGFPWEDDDAAWKAWCQGRTGYPIVDAASRQLLETGFVHNRARMISASFLTKHLLISYQRGESHYMKYLTDGDWAQNNAGWQWSAGCGCDAQPYFRIFNPVTQGETFDPNGDYVRRFVPELASLETKWIHQPWGAPDKSRKQLDYPDPIVDHVFARQRFLSVAKQHLAKEKP